MRPITLIEQSTEWQNLKTRPVLTISERHELPELKGHVPQCNIIF